MPWQPIHRGKPEVTGVDAADPSLLDVTIPLDADPPGAWAAAFLSPGRVRLEARVAAPVLDGRSVRLRALDAGLDAGVRMVDARIAAANAAYAEVAPRLRAGAPRDPDGDARREQRLAQARRQADTL